MLDEVIWVANDCLCTAAGLVPEAKTVSTHLADRLMDLTDIFPTLSVLS